MHSHHHEHHHHDHCSRAETYHQPDNRLKKLRLSLVLTSIYFVAEVIGGFLSGSLALLADAGHMLADIAAIALALFAAWISTRQISLKRTFGYHRMEILAAFINGLALAGISFLVMYEALHRMHAPSEVQGGLMMAVASGGLLINVVVVMILHGGHEHDINIKGAYLHVLGDLFGSVGAIIAALLIYFYGWLWADPAISIVIALLVLYSALRLLMEATDILLESCPAHIDVSFVKDAMQDLDGVLAIHDLHVWTIASGKYALSAHVTVLPEAFHEQTLSALQHCLKEKFGLSHVTLQLEPPHFEEDEIHF